MSQAALAEIYESLLEGADMLLSRTRHCMLFGAWQRVDGTVERVGVLSEGWRATTVDTAIESLENAILEEVRHEQIRCCGVCVDAFVYTEGHRGKSDALILHLEHESGAAVRIVVPYKFCERNLAWGQAYQLPGAPTLFADVGVPLGGGSFGGV